MIFHRPPLKSETFKKSQLSEPIDVPSGRNTPIFIFYVNATANTFASERYLLASETRMHSSRMRTGRTLTVFRLETPLPEKIGDPPKNWRPPRKIVDTPGIRPPPPVDRITDACKNITLAKTSFRPVIREMSFQHKWGNV